MKTVNFKLSLMIALAILLASCTHKSEDINPEVPLDKDTLCDPNLVYFVNDIQPILNSSCAYAGCHDVVTHADGVDLTTYDKVMSTGEVKAGNPNGSELYEKIAKGKMPPSGPLASVQQQKIYDWIMQGAKNNECIQKCDTTNVTYSGIVKTIMDNNCMGCHTGASPGGGVLITNYAETKSVASNGSLLGTIEHKAGFSPMPKGMTKLSDCNISQIKIWINNGMQNN